jgi:ParB/RepB/Spo0J family partition protein
LARPDFRAVAARRLSEERELSPAIVSLLAPERSRSLGVRHVPIDRIEPNPENPRLLFEESALEELAASIREHGVLQPILVRPTGRDTYQLVAGERRWRAARRAGLTTIPALVEELDDDTAMEIAVIENLQREDLSPLEEATMYEKMVTEHGYSIRKLAQKLGKDKGYLENRLRLADAPEEIRALVSVRKDTISHAYELMKVQDPRKRKRLAAQLRERIEGRPRSGTTLVAEPEQVPAWPAANDAEGTAPPPATVPTGDDALIITKAQFQEALGQFLAVLRSAEFAQAANPTDRQNLAKYLTISKLSLENAISVVRGRGD